MQKVNLLVVVEKYRESKYHGMTFVHSRLIEYDKSRFNVKVLSFGAVDNYVVDGIEVLSKRALSPALMSEQDIIISHAPNLKHHFFYFWKYFKYIKKIIFFFHGHEVLMRKKFYPKPYRFNSKKRLMKKIEGIYDFFKVILLKKIFMSWSDQKDIHFVFVSDWMLEMFKLNLKYSPSVEKTHIIHNPINQIFFQKSYDLTTKKPYDFICVRPLDDSKYAIDLLVDIAKMNPQYNFHIFGEGTFFNFVSKPDNVVHHPRFLNHVEISEQLNRFKCAIMLTRLDSQGVMMCEMANFGIPLITSDLPICREMLSEFNNVHFVDNKNVKSLNLKSCLEDISQQILKSHKFEKLNTINKEEELLLNVGLPRGQLK